MRTKMNLLMVTALVLLGASGRAFGAVVVDTQVFKGSQGATSFSGSASIRCSGGGRGTVSAAGFLSGSQTITKTSGAPKMVNNGVFVEVDSYSNTCTGATLGFADGGIANGFTPPQRAPELGAAPGLDHGPGLQHRSHRFGRHRRGARGHRRDHPPRSPRPRPRPRAR